ncbi:hypothetical protein DSO57_1013358 [Entomophthora muscae]|uniref:Uncharacterized protein n=1 Tax=Entomophthora muscae TaxID=34485 RepID=A0ACC2RKJ6_9FUNG|nr:hypothetical protein DSO57_1013358 [Entomophthora muscae]
MENDSVLLYSVIASACIAPLLYSLAGKSWVSSALKGSAHEHTGIQKDESTATLRMMMRCGALCSMLDTQKEEAKRLTCELANARDEICNLEAVVQESHAENQELRALNVVMEQSLKQFQQKASRLSIVAGLSTRQSRLQADELQSLREKLEAGAVERAGLRSELEEALRLKERLNNRLNNTKDILSEREQTITKLNEANFECEAKIKAQRHALQEIVEEKERLRVLAYRSSRDFSIDSISEADTAASKGSLKSKSTLRRLGSFSFGSRRTSRDKESVIPNGTARFRSATS